MGGCGYGSQYLALLGALGVFVDPAACLVGGSLLPEHLGSANSAYELLHRHRYPDAGLRDACARRLSGE